MSKAICIRLNDHEREMLSSILSSENCEAENASEWFRLLLHREWNKRRRLGVPSGQSYSTAFRMGRNAAAAGPLVVVGDSCEPVLT